MGAQKPERILVIDDDPAFRKIMQLRLEAEGYNTLLAEDGLVGLNLAREEVPDLIIIDLLLPKMSGHQISRMLRFDDSFKHIPIVMLTSRDLEEDADKAKECGADAFIVKTTKSKIVMDVVARLLERAQAEKE